MNSLPREIADQCGIVIETTIAEEPVQRVSPYYINQLTYNEYEVGFERDGVKKPIGYIHRDGSDYRAVTTNGTYGVCHSKKDAVEFIYVNSF